MDVAKPHSPAAGKIKLEEYQPSERLQTVVKSYKIIESPFGTVNTILPGTSLTMAFRLKGQTSHLTDHLKMDLPLAAFSGLQNSARQINYDRDSAVIVVLFNETGITSLLKEAAHEFFQESVSLDHIFPASEIGALQERLSQSRDNTSRVAIIEQFLLSKLKYHQPDKLISEAITRIFAANGIVKMNELSDSLYISQDAFEKRFRKTTGATPKQFSRIVRMNAVVRGQKIGSSFLDIAFENGFYDQSHFNKEFKLFTGQTPTDFLRSGAFW